MEEITLGGGSLGDIPILRSVLEKSLQEIDTSMLLNYASPLGIFELRQEIALMHKTNTENVMITSSAQQALSIALNLIESSEFFDSRAISFKEPAYMGFLRLIKKKKVKKNALVLVEEVIGLEDLGFLYLTSNFHNPTGESLSEVQKSLIAEKVINDQGLVIEDNPFDLLYFNKSQPSTIFELAPENTIYIGSLSKILAPGLRVGYILASQENMEKLALEKEETDWFTSTLSQQMCVNALRQKYLDSLREYFKSKRDSALSSLERYFRDEDVSWNIPEGGIFIRLQFKETFDCEHMISLASERHALFLERDGHHYMDGIARSSTRINFAQNPDYVTEEGIRRLHECFKDIRTKDENQLLQTTIF